MEKKRILRVIYEITALLLTAVLLAGGLFALGSRLMPERSEYGAVWSSYLQEEKDSIDVLFLGSSRAYCSVIPARIYQNTGICSYVMAGPSQTVSLTWYYLRECLKTQTPQVVFIEVSCAYVGLTEEYSKANVLYMPLSWNRILAARACEEGILKLALFPLEESHSRYRQLLKKQEPDPAGVMLCGYTPLDTAKEQTDRPYRNPGVRPGDEVYETNLDYFRKMAELCESKGIRCVFFLAPTMRPYTEEESERLFSDLRELPCAAAEDWGDLIEEIGIDPATDWYDSIHFNTNGAVKFTDFLSAYLLELGVSKSEDADTALWERRAAYLEERRR